MTTPTPRWTAETAELVARTIYATNLDGPGSDRRLPTTPSIRARFDEEARAVLTALADAGVLIIPVGGETRQEWGIRHQTFGVDGPIIASGQRGEDSEALARRYATADLTLVSRTVHLGPWREVTDDPA